MRVSMEPPPRKKKHGPLANAPPPPSKQETWPRKKSTQHAQLDGSKLNMQGAVRILVQNLARHCVPSIARIHWHAVSIDKGEGW